MEEKEEIVAKPTTNISSDGGDFVVGSIPILSKAKTSYFAVRNLLLLALFVCIFYSLAVLYMSKFWIGTEFWTGTEQIPVVSVNGQPSVDSISFDDNTTATTTKTLSCSGFLHGSGLANNCWREKAVTTADQRYCEHIPNNFNVGSMFTDQCYLEVAQVNLDSGICELIRNKNESSGVYIRCLAYTKRDVHVCDNLQHDAQVSCVQDVAVATKDPRVCSTLEGLNMYYCMSAVAVQEKDVAQCRLIPDTHVRANCVASVAVSTDDVTVCLESSLINQDSAISCFTNVTIKDKDTCAKLSGHLKNVCENRYYYQLGDFNTCAATHNELEGDLCRIHAVELKGDVTLCEKISTEHFKLDCYRNLAKHTADCSLIPPTNEMAQYVRDMCYADLAMNSQRQSMCENILGAKEKTQCRENTPSSSNLDKDTPYDAVVIGYEWIAFEDSPKFASVILPIWGIDLVDDWNTRVYDIYIERNGAYEFFAATSTAQKVNFPEGGISKFKVLGIKKDLRLRVGDRDVLWGVSFASEGRFNGTREAIIE